MPATHRFPMTSIEWYRVYHGMPEDAKLKVIAKRSQQLMTHVVTVWLCVLDAASRHKKRGTVEVDSEQIAVVQDIDQKIVETILQTFREKGMINEQNRVTSWETRQYLSDKERAQKYRDGKKQDVTEHHEASHGVTEHHEESPKNGKNAPDTENRKQITDSEDRSSDSRTDAEKDADKKTNSDKKIRARTEKREREREKQTTGGKQILEQMLDIWNAEVQSKLTPEQKAKLTPKRKEQMTLRWLEDFQQDIRAWRYYCEIIGSSEFCLGKIAGKNWTIDLSWAVESSDHVAKILEGGFSGGKHPAPPPVCNDPLLQSGWDHVLACFNDKFGKAACKSWLSSSAVRGAEVRGDGACVIITCPNRFVREWLTTHYLPHLKLWWAEHSYQSHRITDVALVTREVQP